MDPINLKQRFGDRYKVEFEQSYHVERPEFRAAEAPWLMMVPCQHGEICPWGDENLAACTSKAGSVAKRLKALPYTTVAQDGDDGANVVFPVGHFDEVVAIMKPRRRRRLSEGQRAAAAEHLRKYQPAKGQSVKDLVRQRSKTAQISTIGASGD
jgi:hypothetical protein